MKVSVFFLILVLSLFGGAFAQESESISITDYKQLKLPQRMQMKGVGKSNIDWDRLDANEWLSFSRWTQVLELRENPDDYGLEDPFRVKIREEMGRVLECIGTCRLYRGLPNNTVQFRSSIREGDDLVTQAESYLWVFLYDGTLVRLSPHTSLSFREINIGKKENFLQVRINQGNVLWLSREKQLFHHLKMKNETDALFLPLSLYETGIKAPEVKPDEENLLGMLEEYDKVNAQYSRLNKTIKENNEWFQKPTYSFIVMQNGSVFGKNLNMEFVTLTGKQSYVKIRKFEQLALQGETPDDPVNFYFRGFENKKTQELGKGFWYEIDEKGRTIVPADNPEMFAMGEFITRNIPTIYYARELMLKKYGRFAHTILDPERLAKFYGYELWDEYAKEKSDFSRRIDFLREYTRRVETTQMVVTRQIRKDMVDNQRDSKYNRYGPHFHSRAAKELKIDRINKVNPNRESLNSEKRELWKKIHAIH